MKVHRIHLTSWTASFRYPNLISGYQPSLPVPPLSTLYGLISAASGHYIRPYDLPIGYIFKSESFTIDLETVYQFSGKNPFITKSNVIRRMILFENSLWLYIRNTEIAEKFYAPHFQLLLGRSGDLASVVSIKEIEIQPINELKNLRGTVVPMGDIQMPAPIQALPIGFTDEIPRRNIGTRPFFLLDYNYEQKEPISAPGFYDPSPPASELEQNPDLQFEIYWHDYTRI